MSHSVMIPIKTTVKARKVNNLRFALIKEDKLYIKSDYNTADLVRELIQLFGFKETYNVADRINEYILNHNSDMHIIDVSEDIREICGHEQIYQVGLSSNKISYRDIGCEIHSKPIAI